MSTSDPFGPGPQVSDTSDSHSMSGQGSGALGPIFGAVCILGGIYLGFTGLVEVFDEAQQDKIEHMAPEISIE